MITLYHHPMLPECRRIRLNLGERAIAFTLKEHKFWERDEFLLAMNPAGNLPVMIDDSGHKICGARPIEEYLDEAMTDLGDEKALRHPVGFSGIDPVERAEIRRLIDWFDHKFFNEVVALIVGEKIFKRLARAGEPEPSQLRIGGQNLRIHLAYLTFLLERREWLAGNHMTVADLAASAGLSVLDYLHELNWNDYPIIKSWYMNIKHRPSFRPLLQDRIIGIPPHQDYLNLDF